MIFPVFPPLLSPFSLICVLFYNFPPAFPAFPWQWQNREICADSLLCYQVAFYFSVHKNAFYGNTPNYTSPKWCKPFLHWEKIFFCFSGSFMFLFYWVDKHEWNKCVIKVDNQIFDDKWNTVWKYQFEVWKKRRKKKKKNRVSDVTTEFGWKSKTKITKKLTRFLSQKMTRWMESERFSNLNGFQIMDWHMAPEPIRFGWISSPWQTPIHGIRISEGSPKSSSCFMLLF